MANTIRLKRGTTEPTAGNLVTGEIAINTGDATVYTKLDDGTVTTIVGKSNNLFVAVRNESGASIPAGSAVYISGASNGKPLITLAQANSEATSSRTLGLTVAAIASGQNGEVIATGLLTKIDTQSYQAGNSLWLSPTVAGGLTTTAPSAPNHAVFIGTVLSSANNGKIEVKVQNGYELQELHNVSITSPTDGQALTYNSTSGLWVNSTVSGSGGGTWGSITGTLSSQTDLQSALDAKANLASPALTGNVTITTNSASAALVIVQDGAGDIVQFKDVAGDTTYSFINASGKVSTIASATANAGFSIAHGAAPTSPVNGDLWTTTAGLFARINGTTQQYSPLASPTFTGTPIAPTATTATNSTQIATTAYVKNQAYATIASPALTGTPTVPTVVVSSDAGTIASTAFVKSANRKPAQTFNGVLGDVTGAFNENVVYLSQSDATHTIALMNGGFYNQSGAVIMFKQDDNTQMSFYDANGYVKAPNGDRFYAAFPNAVVFAVKVSTYDWFIYGDLTSTTYPAYGTVVSGPNIDTGTTVDSGFIDYYGSTVYAYTATDTIDNGWGGQTTIPTYAIVGTVMSDNFTYSNNTDTYNLLADGSGGYSLNFVSSSGGGYDPYGTKIGTPYWDSSYNAVYQTIADGNGGTTSIAWDGYSPYPANGVQVSTTSYNQSGYKTDMIGASYYVYYDSTYYADGNGGSYESWSVSSGYNLPSGWATTAYFYDTSTQNTSTYYYDQYYNYVYPWKWGYVQADGAGGTSFVEADVAPNGTPASDYFYDTSSNYGRIYADGNYGFYFAS